MHFNPLTGRSVKILNNSLSTAIYDNVYNTMCQFLVHKTERSEIARSERFISIGVT